MPCKRRLSPRLPSPQLKGGQEFGHANLYKKCAWQELNLLPFGPEPNALSGELQARDGLCSLNCALRGPAYRDPRSEHPDRRVPDQHTSYRREPIAEPISAHGADRCDSAVLRN